MDKNSPHWAGLYGTAVLEKTFIPDKSENKVIFYRV